MNRPLKSVIGAFRMLRRRARSLRVNGLAIWADAGERGALQFAGQVQATAHRAELAAMAASAVVADVTADGVVTASELKRLQELPKGLNRVADDCHDITEMTTL
jgi:hypothetical protein